MTDHTVVRGIVLSMFAPVAKFAPVAMVTVAAAVFVPGQAQAQSYFGPVAAFHDDFDFGVGAFVSIPRPNWHENLSLLFDAEIFFPGNDINYMTFNGGAAYAFPIENQAVRPFAAAQLAVRRWSWDYDGPGANLVDTSSTDIGLNLGGGVTFVQSSLRPSLAARLELGDGSGFGIYGSVGFPFGGG